MSLAHLPSRVSLYPRTDCDDTPISGSDIHPEADEYCDDLDNDCNNLIDDNAIDGIEYYYDNDLDGMVIKSILKSFVVIHLVLQQTIRTVLMMIQTSIHRWKRFAMG